MGWAQNLLWNHCPSFSLQSTNAESDWISNTFFCISLIIFSPVIEAHRCREHTLKPVGTLRKSRPETPEVVSRTLLFYYLLLLLFNYSFFYFVIYFLIFYFVWLLLCCYCIFPPVSTSRRGLLQFSATKNIRIRDTKLYKSV